MKTKQMADPVQQRPTIAELESELRRVSGRKRSKGGLRGALATLVVVAAVVVLVFTLVMPVMRIYGASMAPTLTDGDIVVALRGGSYERGDVIAFYHNNKILVKRVIALPGESVDILEDGTVLVDGQALEEPYLTQKSLGECTIELPYQVPAGRYFVMGDHRDVSSDSRSTAVGCVAEEQIVGRLALRVWPLNQFGPIQ